MDQKTPRELRNIYRKQGCNFQRDKDGLKKTKQKQTQKTNEQTKKTNNNELSWGWGYGYHLELHNSERILNF